MTKLRFKRRDFIKFGAGALATCGLPTAAVASDGDWKAAFAALGFDPEEPGCSCFAITSDIHFGRFHDHLAEHVAFWNAMNPRPVFVAALGDLGNINLSFGHRPTKEQAARNASVQFAGIRDTLSKGLDPSIRRVYVVGNHDTYPGEDDRALWRTYFPDQPPYGSFDACGIRFVKWDGGGDGIIDAKQEAWIRKTVASTPASVPLVVLVHQPSVGSCGMERDIGRVAKTALAGRAGLTWMLAGHTHENALALWDLPGGGRLAVVSHAKDIAGWWLYGVRNGQIVARLFKAEGRAFASGPDVAKVRSRGEIPLAYQGRTDVVWNAFVGSPEERACRVKLEKTADNGGWLFYVGTTHHRFPKAKVAPRATRFAILGNLIGKRKTREPAKLFLSADGVAWTEVRRSAVSRNVNEFPIPAELVGAETLHARYEAFGYGCDECLAGYAFLA